MRYSVKNSEQVERAVATARQQTIDVTLRDGTVQTNQIAAFRRWISDTLADAVDELQAKVDEHHAPRADERKTVADARKIAHEYAQPGELVDSGSLYYALMAMIEAYDEQAAYIEQVEASYTQMMRSLDEVEARR